MVSIKRVYEPPSRADGDRILVDRLWPRGVRRSAVTRWERDLAPSDALRRWYGHDPARWPEFRQRYRAELRTRRAQLAALAARAARGRVTLLYAAADTARNNAVVLKEVVEKLAGLTARRRVIRSPVGTSRSSSRGPRPRAGGGR
ncbi:MAG TPA: DUF488 family protein [Candidatus Binatia bacterium]|nr:DUF488 family protein [Candidatus Binatia bacterium]